MNRVIKFRVWDENNSEGARMHYFDQMEICDNGVFFQNSKFDLGGGHNDGDNQVLMQFTGLLDKNGREIYEGDVIKSPYTNSTFKVFYSSDRPEFVAEFGMTFLKSDRWADAEIIGNIYESPNLLK